MADTLVNLQDAHIRRRSDKTEMRSIEDTNGQVPTSRVKSMNKNVMETRPEKRAKTVTVSRERFEGLEKSVDIPGNFSLGAQENVHEQIDRQRREAQDNMQQQNNEETETQDQQDGVERKGRDIRFRLEQFYNRQRTKKQQFQAQKQQEIKLQQEPEPTQQQQLPLSSHFHLYPLVEKLAYAVETGTRDQNSDSMVTELSDYFNKSQQMLNSVLGSLGSKPTYVDGQKRKLEDSERLLQQRRELIVEYRKSIEDILKIEP